MPPGCALLDRALLRALFAAALIHGAAAGMATLALAPSAVASVDSDHWSSSGRWSPHMYVGRGTWVPGGRVQLFVPPPPTRSANAHRLDLQRRRPPRQDPGVGRCANF